MRIERDSIPNEMVARFRAPRLNNSQDEVSLTIANIDGALAEIDNETGVDRKKPNALPRIDARMPWANRLSESLRLLEKAEQDCSKEKDTAGDAEHSWG